MAVGLKYGPQGPELEHGGNKAIWSLFVVVVREKKTVGQTLKITSHAAGKLTGENLEPPGTRNTSLSVCQTSFCSTQWGKRNLSDNNIDGRRTPLKNLWLRNIDPKVTYEIRFAPCTPHGSARLNCGNGGVFKWLWGTQKVG